MFATKLQSLAYRYVGKPIFFRFDPESVHDFVSSFGRILGAYSVTRKIVSFLYSYKNQKLEQTILGIKFPNPVGVAAGFDKNARLTDILPSVGFGFEEVGSISGEFCEGNPRPRAWRLVKSKGLLIYYGLANNGSEEIANRLRQKQFAFPIGTSVVKANDACTVSDEEGIADYEKAFRAFVEIGDYFTVNISCPNAYGGQPFTDSVRLEALLTKLDEILTKKPVFLKLSPDLAKTEVDRIIKTAQQHRVAGFICSNLTKRRNIDGDQDSLMLLMDGLLNFSHPAGSAI